MAMSKALQAAHARATARLHKWVDSKIERDAVGITRLYRLSQADLDEKLRNIYFTYLSEEPTYVRARMTGALPVIDRAVDQTIEDVTRKIYEKTRTDIEATLAAQPGKLRRGIGRLKKLGLRFGDLFLTGEEVARALTTDVVVGGTYADRLFHIGTKVKNDLTREIRQGLFNAETFDEVRARLCRGFGVDQLYTPKSHASGSLIQYKNEAWRQWNLLMKEQGKRTEDSVSVWFTMIDENSTPGCVARHGMTLDELDDPDIPHHPNCRCTIMIVPRDYDLSDLKLEASAWLKAEGWTRKDAMLEESDKAGTGLVVRPLRETWERWPGLRLCTFEPEATIAVVDREQARQLALGQDSGIPWATGDSRAILRATLGDTPLTDPIVAVAGSTQGGLGLLGLVEARSGRLLFEARAPRESDSYTRAVCLVPDGGFVWAVSHEDYPPWTLPGGHVEEGEDPKDAAAREFGEETGRAVRIVRYIGEYELQLSTGETSNNMLYEGALTGEESDKEMDKDEGITEVKRVHVIDLDAKEREQVERLWFEEFHKSDLSEAFDEEQHPRDDKGRWTSGAAWQHGPHEDRKTKEEARKYANENFEHSFRDVEGRSVKLYQNYGYKRVNGQLRQDTPNLELQADPTRAGGKTNTVGAMIKHVDGAIEGSTVKNDTVVFRGMNIPRETLAGLKEGDILTDKGYASTSLIKGVAERFGSDTAEIRLPAGSKALSLDEAGFTGGKGMYGPAAWKTSEGEVLLPRGTKFKIVSVKDNVDEGPGHEEDLKAGFGRMHFVLEPVK